MIAGVAGGMAEYANVDVALMRLIWVLAFFAGGVGFLAYIICWIIIPESSEENNQQPSEFNGEAGTPADDPSRRAARRNNAGLLLIGLGIIFLVKNFIPWHYWDKGWPLIIVAIGLYILLANKKGDPQ
jgi:phage shock protein PspC (stress-responsive transcriptional regulator)